MKNLLNTAFWIVTTAFGYAISMEWFLNSLHVNGGGIYGVIMFMQSVGIPLSYGLGFYLFNAVFLIGAFKTMNVRYGLVTIAASLFLSQMIVWVERMHVSYVVPSSPLAWVAIGGVLNGLTIGLSYRADFSLGGIDLLSRMIHVWTKIQVGTLNMALNLVVVSLANIINPSWFGFMASALFLFCMKVTANTVIRPQGIMESWFGRSLVALTLVLRKSGGGERISETVAAWEADDSVVGEEEENVAY